MTATAKDGAGNTSTATFTVTVVDTTQPVITAPNVDGRGDERAGAKATFAPTATDAVGPVTVTTSIASNTTFAIGTTTVTVTATDGHGNVADEDLHRDGARHHRAGPHDELERDRRGYERRRPGRHLQRGDGDGRGRPRHDHLLAGIRLRVRIRHHHGDGRRDRQLRQLDDEDLHGHGARHDRAGDRHGEREPDRRGDERRGCRRDLRRSDGDGCGRPDQLQLLEGLRLDVRDRHDDRDGHRDRRCGQSLLEDVHRHGEGFDGAGADGSEHDGRGDAVGWLVGRDVRGDRDGCGRPDLTITYSRRPARCCRSGRRR